MCFNTSMPDSDQQRPLVRAFKHVAQLLVFTVACGLIAEQSLAMEPRERPVVIRGAGDVSLAGTLLLPEGPAEARFSSLVLLPGSGPTDRDGNQPPSLVTDLLKQLATAFARQGIATLRYDKRGMHANAAQLPKLPAQFGEFFRWENFVADADAAYRFLRQQPEIVPERVGFLGHSEGGVLALVAADALNKQGLAPAAIILASTPGRPLDAVVGDQLQRLLKKQKATAEQTAYFLRENTRISKSIRETGVVPAEVPPGLQALYPSYLGKFLQSNFRTDPCRYAAAYAGPVLIVAGESDAQVSPDRDAALLDAAFRSRSRGEHQLVLAPETSHNLKHVKSPEEPGFAGDLAPELVTAITSWAAEHLSGSQPIDAKGSSSAY